VIIAIIKNSYIPSTGIHALFPGQCLIFEKTSGESLEIPALFDNDLHCFHETRLQQPPHRGINLPRVGLGRGLLARSAAIARTLASATPRISFQFLLYFGIAVGFGFRPP
jgi:hypothetical protein